MANFEVHKLIPADSRLLGMLHDTNFRPTIAPSSIPVKDGRVIFEQNGSAVDSSTTIRVPICLMSMGDTDLLRKIGNPEEGLRVLKTISENSPTAAALFDAYRAIKNNRPIIVWFAEDETFAETASRAIGLDSNLSLLPLFKKQAEETKQLLGRIGGSKGMLANVRMHSFSDREVIGAIAEAINLIAIKQGNPKERKKLAQSSAATVAATHALFPLIESLLGNHGNQAAVQGPVHLETNPPSWLESQELSGVKRLINNAAADWQLNHRSLLPCVINGEPIGEFSVIGDDSPQLRRDQRWKIERWLELPSFPLTGNPIFGHGIGLIDDKEVSALIDQSLKAERDGNIEEGIFITRKLAEKIDGKLLEIKFWK